MKLSLEIIVISVCLFLSSSALAWPEDYVSVFKPVQKVKNISEIQRDLKKDVFQIRSMMNFQDKKIIGLMEDSKPAKDAQAPAEI